MNKRLFTVTFTAVVTLLRAIDMCACELTACMRQSETDNENAIAISMCVWMCESVHYVVTFIIISTTIFLS